VFLCFRNCGFGLVKCGFWVCLWCDRFGVLDILLDFRFRNKLLDFVLVLCLNVGVLVFDLVYRYLGLD